MGLVYGIAHDMHKRVDRQELFSCSEVLEKYKSSAAENFVRGKICANEKDPAKIFGFYKEMFHNLYRLELLKEDWNYQLLEVEEHLYSKESPMEYQKITEAFYQWVEEREFSWEIQKEQLLVYFIYTYFCGAVYDGEILAKAQMAILMVDMLEEMLKARWLRNENMLDMEDVIELTYRFSREVEHSDLNLKKLESLMPEKHGLFC